MKLCGLNHKKRALKERFTLSHPPPSIQASVSDLAFDIKGFRGAYAGLAGKMSGIRDIYWVMSNILDMLRGCGVSKYKINIHTCMLSFLNFTV